MNKVQQRIWKSQSQKGTPKFVMIAISDHADEKGECFPSLSLISEKTGYSVRHCQRIINALVKKGELEIVSGGGRKSNTYRFPKYMTDTKSSSEETYIEDVTPDIYVVAQSDNTYDIDVTHDIFENENCHPTHVMGVTSPMTPMSIELSCNIDISTIKNYVVAPVGDNTAHTPSSTVSDNPTITDAVTTPPTAQTQPTGTIASTNANIPKAEVPNPKPFTIEESATSLDLATKSDMQAHATQPPPVVPPRAETVTRKRAKPVAEEKSETGEKPSRSYSDQQKMVSAIAKVFGWEMNKLTRNNRSLIGKVARDLLEASARPSDVQGLYDFCKAQDWSWSFTPLALTSQWANYYALKHQPLLDYIENEAGIVIPRFKPDPNYKSNIPEYTPSETGEFDYLPENIPETLEGRKAQFENVLMQIVEKMNVEVEDIPEDDELNEVLKW